MNFLIFFFSECEWGAVKQPWVLQAHLTPLTHELKNTGFWVWNQISGPILDDYNLLHLLYQATTWNSEISLWIIKAQGCVVNVDPKDWIFKMSISLILATSTLFLGLYITALNSPLSLSRCQITRGLEGRGRAGCQSWKCDGQLPVIRQILKTKWRVGMDSVSTDSFANCAVVNDWMDSSKGRAWRWKMAAVVEVQLWHLTRQKDIHSAPDTFPASPIQSISTPSSLAFIDLKIDSRSSSAVCVK